MNGITRILINDFKLRQLGIDFMGFRLIKNQENYHHLIVAKRNGGKETYENGSILTRTTSHDYLHRIENYDKEIFYLITSEMIDEKAKGKIDIENLKKIRDLLLYFEKEYANCRTSKGKVLIKEEYIKDRIKL